MDWILSPENSYVDLMEVLDIKWGWKCRATPKVLIALQARKRSLSRNNPNDTLALDFQPPGWENNFYCLSNPVFCYDILLGQP